ncbi:hypothetical protein L198_04488 [Cryptococcus wingfieldii CBS 7118]|uniref:Uncharacterized protein n=1 Tax=Cryptococcus wingfieldii CBS 7118 TaxID=1295528 RepID=A0A1E3J4T4_9TREE|nr:hypothetical protein L198_04488 [Cryptococcus wingfieldii CBS 7118]ODN95869.1 hypothetical protein L198_04488 [Cryptococcus wingfieldii CBS 7118]
MSKNAQYVYVWAVYDRQARKQPGEGNGFDERYPEIVQVLRLSHVCRQMRPLNKTQFKKHSPNVEHRSQKHVGIEIQWSTIWRNVLRTFEEYVAPEEQEDFSFDDPVHRLRIIGEEESQMFGDLCVETRDEASLTWWDDDQEKILEAAHAPVFAKLGMCPLSEEIGVARVWTLFWPMLELVQAPLEAYFESK